MHIVGNGKEPGGKTKRRGARATDAAAADAWAMMMEDALIDIDELDPVACPPDRRYFLKDKQAWIYEHGNICELVFVRTHD
jgi:hypothetical protein